VSDSLAPVPVSEEEVSPEEKVSVAEGFRRRARLLAFIPTALVIFLVGVIVAIARDTSVFKGWNWGPHSIHVVHISGHDWRTGFVRAAVPQIPLSIFNSVIAVCKLSRDLFPEKRFVTPSHVSISVGLMNLVGCWFGSMPVCHGCGGLAGQYRFGARSGLSVAFLGTVKLVVGLILGSSVLRLLSNFPVGLLGVLLFFSGLELAMACRDQNTRLDAFVMLVLTFVSLGTSNLTKGFVIGVIIWILLKLHQLFMEARWPNRDDIFPPNKTCALPIPNA
jgi:MFS superfamily sulfate permease-like transporter